MKKALELTKTQIKERTQQIFEEISIYGAAIIDWHSKAILSHKISNTMDCTLVMDVLNDTLKHYGTPEVFNTDQGSQYTSEIHT